MTAMDPKIEKIANSLKQQDLFMLHKIYQLRCLTLEQAWSLFYKPSHVPFGDFMRRRIIPLVKLKCIFLISNKKTYAIFLTNLGIHVLHTRINLTMTIYDAKNKKIENRINTQSDLELLPKFLNHQCALNQFVLDFDQRFKAERPDDEYQYYDEKYVSIYRFIRPDGLLSFGDIDFFIEQDMNTESRRQLEEKWNRYRTSYSNGELRFSKRKIIILFIIDCPIQVLKSRKRLVKETVMKTFIDEFDDNVDLYVGTRHELLNAIFQKILPLAENSYFFDKAVMDEIITKKHGYTATQGDKLRKVFYQASYGYYIRKINSKNKIIKVKGKVQEFLFDENLFSPLSILNKIQYFDKNVKMFEINYQREINYLILVNNVEQLFDDLISCNLLGTPKVYYTTVARLQTLPFAQAVFFIDANGQVFRFSDDSFFNLIYERNLFAEIGQKNNTKLKQRMIEAD